MNSRFDQGPEASPTINLLSFNLRCNTPRDGANAWPYRKELVAGVFTDHRVDFAGLQEAQAEHIGDLRSLLPDYGWIGVGRDDGKSGGEAGPIFYRRQRFAVEKQGTFWLSEHPAAAGSKSWDSACPRIATWGIFHEKTTGQRLLFINTHFDHVGLQARQHSARLLLERIINLYEGLPVVLTGDFNCEPDSSPVATLVGDPILKLRDARHITATPHAGGNQSFNEFKTDGPDLVIDFIFVGPGIQVQSHGYYRTVEEGVFVSDHWPVVSRILLPA